MKNKLKKLVELSYINEKLDPEVVDFIANRLSRQELKLYISFLKQEEDKKRVYVTVPKELSKNGHEKIQRLFSNKTIDYSIDPSMIGGIKVVEKDIEFEINLDKTFRDIILFLSKND